MQSTVVSSSWLQSSLQKMLSIPFTFCIRRQKTGLLGAVAVASLRASWHIWNSSSFQQTQDLWEVPLTTTSFLGTPPQGKHRCQAPRLSLAHLPADRTRRDQPGQSCTSPRWQQAMPPRTIRPRGLLPLTVIQLSGHKMNSKRRTMEKGALPTLPAPGVHPPVKAAAFHKQQEQPSPLRWGME